MVKRPLEDVLVLDLTRVLAGPFCSLQLADMGARVIKVEIPGQGDDARYFGPFIGEESAYFSSLNRNKESMTLNLKTEKGKEIFKELVKKADILIENFRPGAMEALGLGYDSLSTLNPQLIYGAISGFGSSGPEAQRPAYDIIAQARGGVMSITGNEGGEPTRVGVSIGDLAAALFATTGILAALLVARSGGGGQKIDISMLDSQVAFLENAIARYAVTREVPSPLGNRHPSITPFSSFKTSDTPIVVAAGNDQLFKRLCNAMDRPDFIEDRRFQDNASRTSNGEDLYLLLQEIFLKRPSSYWLNVLERERIPCAPIQNVAQVLEDPQVKARDMVQEIRLSNGETLPVAGIPLKFSKTICKKMSPPPLLGEQTEEILRELLSLSKEEYERWKKEGVV